MKNKEFFYQQYNKLKWENQEKTKINSFVNNYIIKKIIQERKDSDIKLFDIGFGIGFFFRMLSKSLPRTFKNITLEGCEPSNKNYSYFLNNILRQLGDVKLKTYNKTFLDTKTETKFDLITAIYVFPHFASEDLEEIARKIHLMLKEKGKFILVVTDEKYLQEKLKVKKDLFIERNIINLRGKNYGEILHYSEIPEIGTIIDYNREERYYLDLFSGEGFKLTQKMNLEDKGFICTLFVFER